MSTGDHDLDNGQRSPKRRRLDADNVDASKKLTNITTSPHHHTVDIPSSRRPSSSSVTGAATPVQDGERSIDSPKAPEDAFLHEPRPLPRQRLRSVEPPVTPGLDSTSIASTPFAGLPEQPGFLEDPRMKNRPVQSHLPSTYRSTTPVTQDGYQGQASSPVPSHSTTPDIEADLYKDVSPVDYRPQLILRGHKRAIAAVKFSPDGKWIASCCKLFPNRIHSLLPHIASITHNQRPTKLPPSRRRNRPHLLRHHRPNPAHLTRPPRRHLLSRLVSRLHHPRHRFR